ncbi:MAG: hypothetical protein RI897_4025 [Verrucomicrobiota bacterium]
MGFIEDVVEGLPAGDALGEFDPDIGGIDATVDTEAGGGEAFAEDGGITEVELDEFFDLGLPFGGVEGFGGALDDIADAVEFGGHAPCPERVEGSAGAIGFIGHEIFRDNCEGAAGSGESAIFGEATEFDGAFACSVDFKDGVGDIGFGDIGFVGCVVEDDGAVFAGIIDPGSQLFAGRGGAGGVIGVAEVDEVDGFGGDGWDEAVFGGAGEVDQSGVGA